MISHKKHGCLFNLNRCQLQIIRLQNAKKKNNHIKPENKKKAKKRINRNISLPCKIAQYHFGHKFKAHSIDWRPTNKLYAQ